MLSILLMSQLFLFAMPAASASLGTYLFFSSNNIIENPAVGFQIVAPCTGTPPTFVNANPFIAGGTFGSVNWLDGWSFFNLPNRPGFVSASFTCPTSPMSADARAASAVETSGPMGIIIGAVVGVIAVGVAIVLRRKRNQWGCGACIGFAIVLRRNRTRRGGPRDIEQGGVQDPGDIELMTPRTASRTTSTLLRTASRTTSTLLPEALDRVLLRTRVRRLRPMLKPGKSWILHSPGVLRAPVSDCKMRITASRLYIEQKDAADGANSSGALELWPLAALTSVRRRRYELRHTVLELKMGASQSGQQSGGAPGSVVLEFNSHEEREKVVSILVGQQPHLRPLDEQLPEMTEKWHAGEIDNYTYLLHLNDCASRSFDDLSQYPIMPWVLSDYSSDALDLNDPRRYRPLWKPVGALDERRLAASHSQRLELQVDAEAGQTIPLYRTHYSSPAYVAYYLLRIFPELTIHIQSGEFDQEARSFSSVDKTWRNVSERGSGDVKELIPQFYSDPAFLTNDMGDSDRPRPSWCEDVVLPPWAGGSYTKFVRQMRAALESDFVSAHLHLWIDLIFGSKQQGAPALRANNLFDSYTYESALKSGELDDATRELIRTSATEIGQTPPQLFASAHPPRRLHVNGLPQPWRAAEPSATLIQANARRWLGRRRIVEKAVEFFFDEKAFRGTASLSIEVPPVDVVLRTDYTDGFSFAYSKRTADWMLALAAAPEEASDEHEIGMFLESCFRSDDERRYAPSECHPFANAMREYCGLVSQLFALKGRSPVSRMTVAVRLKNLSKAVQLGLKRMHAIIVRVLPPVLEPRRSALVRALVLDEITTRLFRPLIMPLIQSVHGFDDAAYADSVARFAQLLPHHLEGIVNLPSHFWLGSRDADASHVPYATAIKALSHLSATYSTRRKLALLMNVLQAIQHHVWSYHGIASPEDQANDRQLRLAADDLISVVAFVLSQARPVLHLCSELAFIERFADDGCLLGEHGYCLATVQAASGFLRTLTWPQIANANAAKRKQPEAQPLTPVDVGQKIKLRRGRPSVTPSNVGAATTPMTLPPPPPDDVPRPPPDGVPPLPLDDVPPPPHEDEDTELSRRLDALQADGWQAVDVDGDGNCFFRALAKLVYWDEQDEQEQEHGRARQETIRYMREHREEFDPFVHDVDFDSYVDRMSREGTYVEGEIELMAAANTFNVRIRVYGRSEDHDRTFAPLISNDETRDVCMAHDQARLHYFVLERMEPAPTARGGLARFGLGPTAAPAAHDAGIDYGVLAADIAAPVLSTSLMPPVHAVLPLDDVPPPPPDGEPPSLLTATLRLPPDPPPHLNAALCRETEAATAAAAAASTADAGSSTPKPQRPLGAKYSGIVERIRNRKADKASTRLMQQ